MSLADAIGLATRVYGARCRAGPAAVRRRPFCVSAECARLRSGLRSAARRASRWRGGALVLDGAPVAAAGIGARGLRDF